MATRDNSPFQRGTGNPTPARRDEGTLVPDADLDAATRMASVVARTPVKPTIPGYDLDKVLGQGTFGEVWSAVQVSTRHRVAVKVLHRRFSDAHFLEREVDRLCNVAEHPHVVTLLDASVTHDPPYLVTPLLSGSLEPLAEAPYTNVEQAVTWFVQMAQALQYVHGKGILHCDLKPGNILLDEEGAVRVVDFGQAAMLNEQGMSLGTFWYMSPEQAAVPEDGKIVPDVCWDVYSLGATMYKLLTGELPRHSAEGEMALSEVDNTLMCLMMYQSEMKRSPLVPVRSKNRRVDEDLAAIVEHCLALDVARRYQNMGEVLEDLKRRRARLPLLARPRTPAYVLRRFLARNPIPLAAVLVIVAVVATAFARVSASRNVAEAARAEAISHLADLEYERGQTLAEKSDSAGMLWLARSITHEPGSIHFRMTLNSYLQRSPRLVSMMQHKGAVVAAALSADGTRVVTASSDGFARVWDLASGRAVSAWMPHDGPLTGACFSPDGTRVATASQDKTARLWEASSGNLLHTLKHDGAVVSVSFSPDGRRVLTAAQDHAARLWDASNGQQMAIMIHAASVLTAAFSADGTRIVTGTDIAARVWDGLSGRSLSRPLGHEGPVYSAMFVPGNNNRILTGSGDKTARIWDYTSYQMLSSMKHEDAVFFVSMSGDGKRIATGTAGGQVYLWDAATSQAVLPAPLDCGDRLTSTTLSPDGRLVLTSSEDGRIRLSGTDTVRSQDQELRQDSPIMCAQFVPHSQRILSGAEDGVVRIWEVGNPDTVRILEQPQDLAASAFSPDGRRVVTGAKDGTVRVWNTETGKPVTSLKHGEAITAVAFSPDGKQVLTASADRTARLWDAADGHPLAEPMKHEATVNCAVFSPDGKHVATAWERSARVWDTKAQISCGDMIRVIAFSPDGQNLATACGDGTARVWNAQTGEPVTPPLVHGSMVYTVRFSPDGTRLATASWDKTARVWDARTGSPVGPPIQHRGRLYLAVFSPDGNALATASEDGTARVWSSTTGKPLSPVLKHASMVTWAAFSPDGRLLATASADATARVWDVASGHPVGPPLPHPMPLFSVEFSPDGRRLLTGCKFGGAAYVWNVGADEDEPPDQVEVETQMWTGLQLDNTGALRNLSEADLGDVHARWQAMAEQHAKACKFHEENVWTRQHRPPE